MDHTTRIELNSGNEIPVIGLGTWQLTNDTAIAISNAIKIGYRMIDTSSDYGTQKGIAEGIKQSGINRKELYLVTKVEENDDSYKRTFSNLKELSTDYVDLMLVHRPPKTGAGESLWSGLIQARDDGLVRDIGVSNYSVELIDELIGITGEAPVVNQIEWSPFGYSQDMINYCTDQNIAIQAYSPLTRATRLYDAQIVHLAEKYNKTPAQILLRWNIQNGFVPIPKASNRIHQKDNLSIFDFEIEEEDMGILNALNENYSSLGTLPYIPQPTAFFV
jgi:2,5-diketo-D-gluconate reductase A